MADQQPEERPAKSMRTEIATTASAPRSVNSPQKPSGAVAGSRRTEVPREPENPYHAFEAAKPDPTAIGAPDYERSLILDKRLGEFLTRAQLAQEPTYVNINATAHFNSVRATLTEVLRRNLSLSGDRIEADIEAQATRHGSILAQGVCILTYLKLRAVNSLEINGLTKFSKKPQSPEPFKVPYPFALAISALGVVKVSSLTSEKDICPSATQEDAARFLLPANTRWSTARYALSKEFAEKIGMKFASVDLSVKLGGSWWLFRPVEIGTILALRCTLPEDNYTEETAVMRTLYLRPEEQLASNEIFDLSDIDDHDYGSFIKNPFDDINVTTYFAFEEVMSEVWKVI